MSGEKQQARLAAFDYQQPVYDICIQGSWLSKNRWATWSQPLELLYCHTVPYCLPAQRAQPVFIPSKPINLAVL